MYMYSGKICFSDFLFLLFLSFNGHSGSWWWTGRPGVLRFMGSQRVGHDWATELNWTVHALLDISFEYHLRVQFNFFHKEYICSFVFQNGFTLHQQYWESFTCLTASQKLGISWRRLSTEELMLLNCGVGEDSWESLGLQGDPTSPFWRRSTLGFPWKEWC